MTREVGSSAGCGAWRLHFLDPTTLTVRCASIWTTHDSPLRTVDLRLSTDCQVSFLGLCPSVLQIPIKMTTQAAPVDAKKVLENSKQTSDESKVCH